MKTRDILALGEGKPTWPCGHPRIAENMAPVGQANGFRCRICRRAIKLRWFNKRQAERGQ